jgi:hypothetical protein
MKGRSNLLRSLIGRAETSSPFPNEPPSLQPKRFFFLVERENVRAGTPRDYEFYVAVRVMMRSLARLGADRVLIASADVPRDWVRAM